MYLILFHPPIVPDHTPWCHSNSIMLPSVLYHSSNKFWFEKLNVNARWTVGSVLNEFYFHFDKVIMFLVDIGLPATSIALEEKSCLNWSESIGCKRTSQILERTRFWLTKCLCDSKFLYEWKHLKCVYPCFQKFPSERIDDKPSFFNLWPISFKWMKTLTLMKTRVADHSDQFLEGKGFKFFDFKKF